MYKTILLICLILFTGISHADWSTSSGEVTSVYSHDGAHVIRTTLTDGSCEAGNYWWPADDPDAKDMFSLALAALMSGKNIAVVYSDANPDCAHGNSAKITHMRIIK